MARAAKIEGRESHKLSFDFKGKELNCEIQEPTFEQIATALSQRSSNGRIDLVGAGKVIWELCCISADKEIEENPKVLISLCVDLYTDFADPVDIEIKKK